MQLRDDGQGQCIPYPNTWNFPGGYLERHEAPLLAAIREMKEEFDINIDPAACRQIWTFTHEHALYDYVFLCEVPDHTSPVLQEGAAFAWMTLEEIANLALGFGHSNILAHIPS